MRFIRNRRVVATIVAASCAAVPASASASPDVGPLRGDSDAAQSTAQSSPAIGVSDAAQSTAQSTTAIGVSDAAQSGSVAVRAATFPPAGFRGGDTKADAPGIGEAPAVPTTIEVVRPERTIVRDVDEALPLILSGTALLLVLGGIAFTLVYARPLARTGRSH
jgi:hypothetical protein